MLDLKSIPTLTSKVVERLNKLWWSHSFSKITNFCKLVQFVGVVKQWLTRGKKVQSRSEREYLKQFLQFWEQKEKSEFPFPSFEKRKINQNKYSQFLRRERQYCIIIFENIITYNLYQCIWRSVMKTGLSMSVLGLFTYFANAFAETANLNL